MLHADIFILHLLGLALGGVQRSVKVTANIDLVGVTAAAGHTRQLFDLLHGCLRKGVGVSAQGGQQLRDKPVLLLCQGGEQMFLLYGVICILYSDALRRLQRFHRFLGKLIGVHSAYLLILQIPQNFNLSPRAESRASPFLRWAL